MRRLSTPIRKFCDISLHTRSGGDPFMSIDAFEEPGEVVAGEGPIEGPRRLLVAVLEAKQLLLEIGEGREVVRREKLALDDREVDLDLVKPAGMHRGMHQDEVWPLGLETTDRPLAAMGRAIVDDPEHPAGRAVGLMAHDLIDQTVEGRDSGLGFAAAEQLGTMDIPGGEIGPGAGPLIFVLDPDRLARPRRQRGMLAPARLDAGLLVGAQHIVAPSQGNPLPAPLIEIEDAAGFGSEVWIAREDPAAMAPGPQRILAEPAPQGRAADLSHQALGHRLLAQIAERPARQGQTM